MATTTGLSQGSDFLYNAVLKPQPNMEAARRFFATLRLWAETKRAYKGKVFTTSEVEEAISACERVHSGQGLMSTPSSSASSASPPSGAPSDGQKSQSRVGDEYWPRWALDANRGVEVLAPSGRGKPPSWIRATPVAIGYRGQKKRYLFVRTDQFEMDARKSEVRKVGGGLSVSQLLEELLARGEDPQGHPDWTDGSDIKVDVSKKPRAQLIFPGLEPSSSSSSSATTTQLKENGADISMIEALEDEFERMALLRRSNVVKMKTCDHPDPLSEPRAAASIQLPELTDRDCLALPAVVAEERLSSLQLETVCFAARRFRTTLPDGRTGGYVLGDGTGCGKGRVISALIYHMWNSGHRRSIWVSATSDLYYDACRDLQDLGADIPCMPMRRLPPSGALDRKGSEAHKELVRNLGIEGDGVIFLTYSLLVQTGQRREVFPCPIRTKEARQLLLGGLLDASMKCQRNVEAFGGDPTVNLRSGDHVVGIQNLRALQAMEVPFTVSFERVLQQTKTGKDDKPSSGSDLTPWNSRLGQLVAWLGGGEATGLICFDEVHKAKNLVPDKDDQASTKTGLFVDLLQQSCPKAPVLYVSATAATEVQHLGYMSRLGVWGQGTAFENFHDFMKTIQTNGVAAMEMFAINMKAIGAMSCRALAYVGTEFETRQCGLTKEQLENYDAAARFWQKVLRVFRKFVESEELRDVYQWTFFKKLKEKLEKQEKKERKSRKEKSTDDSEDPLIKRLWQFFWGAQQRFFKAMCNSAKVPAACVLAQEAVDRGEQVVMSIWATGEARSQARMARLKEETPGRVVIENVCDGGLTEVVAKEQGTLKNIVACLYSNLRLKSNLTFGGKQVSANSQLREVNGKRIGLPEELLNCSVPVKLVFRSPTTRRLAISAKMANANEPVLFELSDDALGERVIISKVLEGPDSFKRAEIEGWHIKTINGRPVGKVQVQSIRQRLRKGQPLAFQDAVIPEHLSGPQMILEHFLTSCMLCNRLDGSEIDWAKEAKDELMQEMNALKLPPNAMDEIVDNLGGLKKVAEMSGRSHRIKRRKDGTLAYVARCEELRCNTDGVNMVEQVLFQKGTKKICVVTEVASAGISLHADRRQVRKDFQPPRRTMISVELPWGADKAIQCFGRVHRANQLIPPRFLVLTTPLGGEVRFNSAIARRMKLLGAVTKGDRMTSMGGVADRHMNDFDVNNGYGRRALATLYTDTTRNIGMSPDLLNVYESLPFIGEENDEIHTWPTWDDFAQEAGKVWGSCNLHEDLIALLEEAQEAPRADGSTLECAQLNRFFNRILMLEVHLQNAMFETFFAIYTELVRVDRANGLYDEGIDSLNQAQGRRIRKIEVEHRELLYRDPGSGAETRYVRLRLDRGISWEAVKEAYDAIQPNSGSIEGFYEYRKTSELAPVLLFVKERLQLGGAGSSGTTWMARRRKKEYVIWRADHGAKCGHDVGRKAYFESDFTNNESYSRLEGTPESLIDIENGWERLYEESAHQRQHTEHILTGDVLTAWRLVNGGRTKRPGGCTSSIETESSKLQIVRAITQPDGEPVVGMRMDEVDLPKLRYVLSCQQLHAQDLASAEKTKAQLGIREAVPKAADLLLKLLWAAGDPYDLPFATWLEAHKALAEEGLPRSVDGLRAMQMAVEKLVKRKILIANGEYMQLHRSNLEEEVSKPPTGDVLEALLFPEEFDVIDSDADDCEFSDLSGDEQPSENEGDEPVETVSTPLRKRTASSSGPKKRGRTKETATADDEMQNEETSKDRSPNKPRRTRQSARKTPGKVELRRKSRKTDAGFHVPEIEGEDTMFQELFGDDDLAREFEELADDVDMEDASPESQTQRKQKRDSEIAQALFGDFEDDA